jgi:hypothetical protein
VADKFYVKQQPVWAGDKADRLETQLYARQEKKNEKED